SLDLLRSQEELLRKLIRRVHRRSELPLPVAFACTLRRRTYWFGRLGRPPEGAIRRDEHWSRRHLSPGWAAGFPASSSPPTCWLAPLETSTLSSAAGTRADSRAALLISTRNFFRSSASSACSRSAIFSC